MCLGYSGVAIYTRNALCAPIRAEEGITGILTPPNSSTSFYNLPEEQQIGGYPTLSQLADCPLDAATLDSEGRCVILEFPAFVLIGVYNPANRDESRDEFRLGFLNALDSRVRNLVAAGKRVFLTGDLNIIREELDTANAEEQLKKHGLTGEEYVSTPARRMLNQLLVGGKVMGERDEGREEPVMWDICRSFHPTRKGMFTCWEQKINARPGNFGSRIDYVLCSKDWKGWFCESNIQEGLMGSDHCPVYAILKQKVVIQGHEVDIRDIMSSDLFKNGERQKDWSVKDLLPMSAKLIPEFDRRRSIKDMFTRKPSVTVQESSASSEGTIVSRHSLTEVIQAETVTPPRSNMAETFDTVATGMKSELKSPSAASPTAPPTLPNLKRQSESSKPWPVKRSKFSAGSKPANSNAQAAKGQSSLMGFFRPKTLQSDAQKEIQTTNDTESENTSTIGSEPPTPARSESMSSFTENGTDHRSPGKAFNLADQESVIDPIVAKESWSKILGKRVVPRCDHNEPCISMVTKKAGINCGRSFYMCPRPLGPSGQKEKNSQWRCGTFIWSSDWTGEGT
jgi:AP endonuclease-2